jgi:hypothetical protein
MNDRETRLRARIDQLIAQRDAARERASIIPKLRGRIRQLEKSRELWRIRAMHKALRR